MQRHQRIALALRVARGFGAEVQVSPFGGGLYFYVPSPVDAKVAAALLDAGFAATPLGRRPPDPTPFVPPYGSRGWETTCAVPSYRATEFLLSLDGEGPLPERAPRARTPRKRAPRARPAAPAPSAPEDAPDGAVEAVGGVAAPLPPVTVLRAGRGRRVA